MSTDVHPVQQSRGELINELMLDMIANTDCSWATATAAIAFWEYHYNNHTAPVYGVVGYQDEKPNVIYDGDVEARSLKVGVRVADSDVWYFTIQSYRSTLQKA